MVKCGCGSGDSNTSFSGAVCTFVMSVVEGGKSTFEGELGGVCEMIC